MRPAEPIIFAATKIVSGQRCVASIVSSHRGMDVTLVQSSWTVRSCTARPVELTCGTFPLETVSYAEGGSRERMSDCDLIRWAGQNQAELYLSRPFAQSDSPLFLTTGNPEITHYYHARFRLAVRSWGVFPDFLASQRFWIAHYQAQVAAGRNYLEERLVDLDRQGELACRIELAPGDAIPVTVVGSGSQRNAGCLLIKEAFPDGVFGGLLCMLGEWGGLQSQIRRLVRWNEAGEEKTVDSVIAEIIESEALR